MIAGSWIPHSVEFVSDLDRPELAVSPWAGHRWFAYDLVRWARPRRIVELGTHYGCSYFAFCQAVSADQSTAEVTAVDTWEGEEHAGRYTEEVFESFTSTLERRFADVRTRVLRMTFDEALASVDDETVDILHIDGLHTYEAVSHDYLTWKDKIAPNGIVLFHDVAPSSGYGSAQFWQEVSASTPSFSFMHSFGLGVLLPNGTDGRDALLELGSGPWKSFYEHRAGHDLRGRQVVDLMAMVDSRSEALAATEELVVARDEALRAIEQLVDDRSEALRATEQLVDDRSEALRATEQLVDDRSEALVATEGLLVARDQELARVGDRLGELEDALAATIADRDERVRRAQAERDGVVAALTADIDCLHHELAVLTIDRDALAEGLDRYRRWLRPVRWIAGPPRLVVRRLRGRRRLALPGPTTAPAPSVPDPARPAVFDAAWYRARYPDIDRAGADPWSHWSRYGWREGREPCPLFNAGTYLEQNPDVAAAGRDPLEHWRSSGWRENRDPSALFSTSFYRERNAELLGPEDDPLEHYLTKGMADGLFVSPDHEQSVLDARSRPAPIDELLTDIVVHQPDGTVKSLPYAMVADLDADLFTFDLWDTILSRSRPADAAKLATARRIRLSLGLGVADEPSTWDVMRRRVAIEAEIAGPANGEYLLGDVLVRLLRELAPTGDVDIPGLADTLRRAELDDEIAGTVALGETLIVIEKLLARDSSTHVAVLSDFYLGGDDLRSLLAHHGVAAQRLEVVSSADLGRSKHARGALFEWARDRFQVTADRHVHVGDNPHADVEMQTATGGLAIHLVHGTRRFVGPGQLDPMTMPDLVADLGAELDAAGDLRARQAGLRPRPENRVVRAAWRTALLPVALVSAAIEDAVARGLDRVHYLSREGLFLAKIHDEIADILVPAGTPDAVHLAVSRRSTFGPSLTEISPESLLDLWRMYSRQTPRGLLVSLGADTDDYAENVRRAGLELDEVIDGVHLDDRVRRFIADADVGRRLQALNAERRAALLSYLDEQTDLEQGEMLVVDVGWRGTVQDNLARLLPDTSLVGWYLALFPFLNPQPANCAKFAVGPDANDGEDHVHMEPPAAVERPWTPATPSVVDYRCEPTGESVPVLDEEVLAPTQRAMIARYQEAVVEAAPMVARWIVANGASTEVIRPTLRQVLAAYYESPEPGIADLWFDTAHDDTFGVLNVTSFGKERPTADWLHDGVGPGLLRHLDAAATASLWPEGYRRWRPVEAAVAVERAIRTGRFER